MLGVYVEECTICKFLASVGFTRQKLVLRALQHIRCVATVVSPTLLHPTTIRSRRPFPRSKKTTLKSYENDYDTSNISDVETLLLMSFAEITQEDCIGWIDC